MSNPDPTTTRLFVDILLVRNVLHNVRGPVQPLRITVRNLEAKLVLHGHHYLHMVQGVQAQVIYEMRISLELQWKRRIEVRMRSGRV